MNTIMYTEGTPTNWATMPTSELDTLKLGLYGNSGMLDFSKVNRLHYDLPEYWKIRYQKVKINYGLINDFALGIQSPVEIKIDSYSAAGGQINVQGRIVQSTQNLRGADIWVFVIDASSNVNSNVGETTTVGTINKFDITVTAAMSGYYTIVVMAKVSDIYEDYKVFRLKQSGLEYILDDLTLQPYVRDDQQDGRTIAVSQLRTTGTGECKAIVVFPYSSSDVQYYSAELSLTNLAEGNVYYEDDIPIPAEGFAVVVVQERDGINYRAGYMGIPMFLSFNHGEPFGASNLIQQENYLQETQTLLIRNRIVVCNMWYW